MISPYDLKKGSILVSRGGETITVKQNDKGGWVGDDTEKPVALYMAYLQDAKVKEKLKINDCWLNEYKKVYETRPDIVKAYEGIRFRVYKMVNRWYAEEM